MEHKPTILVVEDEQHIRDLVETVLTENGFVTAGAESAEKALKIIPSLKPSLILLDIQLPGIDGLECCKRIRADSQMKKIPIIFLSVQSSDIYKITGLESGADDFISKPFNGGELIARVRAVLRRSQNYGTPSNNLIRDGAFTLDMGKRIALIHHKPVKLAHKELDLMALLIEFKGKVLSREIISVRIWEHQNLDTSRTIDVHVARLRKKLGKFAKVIQTVGKIGYRYTP